MKMRAQGASGLAPNPFRLLRLLQEVCTRSLHSQRSWEMHVNFQCSWEMHVSFPAPNPFRLLRLLQEVCTRSVHSQRSWEMHVSFPKPRCKFRL
jgi:hypothetical protein